MVQTCQIRLKKNDKILPEHGNVVFYSFIVMIEKLIWLNEMQRCVWCFVMNSSTFVENIGSSLGHKRTIFDSKETNIIRSTLNTNTENICLFKLPDSAWTNDDVYHCTLDTRFRSCRRHDDRILQGRGSWLWTVGKSVRRRVACPNAQQLINTTFHSVACRRNINRISLRFRCSPLPGFVFAIPRTTVEI